MPKTLNRKSPHKPVYYQRVVRKSTLEIKDFNAAEPVNQTEYDITHIFLSTSKSGLGPCISLQATSHLGMDSGERLPNNATEIINAIREDHKANQPLVLQTRLRKSQIEEFKNLWYRSDEKVLEFAVEAGLLIEETGDPVLSVIDLHNPKVEPLLAWRIESYIFSVGTSALMAFRKLKAKNLGGKELNYQFERELRKVWKLYQTTSNPIDEKQRFFMPIYIRHLIMGPALDDDYSNVISTPVYDWPDIVTWVVNYYLTRTCTVKMTFGLDDGTTISPKCLLGALWLSSINSYWLPSVKERFCMDCGASIAHLPPQSKYCRKHQSSAARQRRQRAKSNDD